MSYTAILPLLRGGTGATTASGARTNLGVASATSVVLRDGTQAFTGTQSMGGFALTNLLDPVSAQDAATKTYVDSQIQGVTDIKQSVRVATVGSNISLSGGAPDTLDGVALAANDRILVKDQTTGSQNGLYYVSTLGTGADGTWTRTTDADVSSEVTAGLFTFVTEGTVNADNGFILITNDPIVLGTTSLSFTQFTGLGQITAGAGLTKTANTLDVVGTSNRITVNADSIDIAATYVGQSSITTLGTITTGVWNGTTIAVADGGTGATTASGARSNLAAAPNTPQYLTLALDSELTSERVLTGTANRITITDGGANGNATLDIGTDVVTLTGTQTLTNKTLTSPTVNTPTVTHSLSTKTATYTLVLSDDIVLFNVSSGATAALPAASTATGVRFCIKNLPGSTANVTVDPNSAELVEGASTYVLQPGDSADIVCDGTSWYLV